MERFNPLSAAIAMQSIDKCKNKEWLYVHFTGMAACCTDYNKMYDMESK